MNRVSLALLLGGLLSSLPAAAQTSVFINELHYDNASTDSNEAVEVAGPAGESLTGWSLVLYNGNGGASYATLALSGTIADTCAGFGAVTVAAPGIQNGSPDGVALVNALGNVVQFLSYEGAFVAVGGPADGLTSVDIGVAETGMGAATSSLQLTGTGTTYQDFTWTEATASMGACNSGQTFVGGIDSPPDVFASAPIDGATGVSAFANLSVTFTEDVALAPTWFTLTCATSGNVTGIVAGGPRTFTIDPSVNLEPGEACTLTVIASAVTDLDAPSDPMAQDATIDFTIAPDTAPAIEQTQPAQGASSISISTHVVVTFNEPVTVSANAFDLDCTASGVHAISVIGGPVTYTIDPAVDLDYLETCTLTVLASEVMDLDGLPDNPIADATITFGTEQSLADYYATADDTSAATLRATLHAIINDHVRFPYTSASTDTWDILDQADEDPMAPTRVLDVYKNESYAKAGAGNTFYNREHRWAKSFGFPDDTSNSWAYTDTHHLIVSNSGYNSARNNRYFDNCPDACTEYPTTLTNGLGGGSGSYPGNSNWGKGERWEVWHYRKGDVARAMLYMDVRYEGGTNALGAPEPDLVLTNNPALIQTTGVNTTGTAYLGLLCVLVDWHEQDPPDELERLRNALVQSYQENRNPFVDHPEWADIVFGAECAASNQAPSLGDASFMLAENTSAGALILTLTATDPDAGQTLSYVILSGNDSGAFALNGSSGQLTVASAAPLNYEATPTFTLFVRVSDNAAPTPATDTATITINLSNVEEGPAQAAADAADAIEDGGVLDIDVLSNDVADPDGDTLAVTGVTDPSNGSAAFTPGGATYTPDTNFCGTDNFDYTLGVGISATVTVTVVCVNDAPAVNDATFSIAENSTATTVVGQVVASDVDAGTTLGYAISGGNDSGAFTISASGQISVANSLPLNFETAPQFVLTVTVTDNASPTAASDTATVTIHLTNVEEGSAQAADDSANATEDGGQIAIGVLANDSGDPDGDALTITGVTDPANGSASFSLGSVSYTPDPNFCGSDSFDYGLDGGSSATVTITVACVNDAPTAVGALPAQTGQEGVAIASFSIAGGFVDIDAGDELDYSQIGLPPALLLDAESGAISGTPTPGSAAGSVYTVTVTASDGEAQTQQSFQYSVAPATPSEPHIFGNGFEG